MSEIMEHCLPVEENDDSCRRDVMEIVSVTDGPCTTQCDSGDWPAEVKQKDLPYVKHEPDEVCCIVTCHM